MADAEWRKLRSRRFAHAKAFSNSSNPAHPAFDEACGLIAFGYLMCREPETAFAGCASYLRADKVRDLNQKFPRQNFDSIEEWVVAVTEEINSDLNPGTPGFAAIDPDKLDPATEALRSDIKKMHSFVTTIHMREFLDDDFEQQECLDARFARLRKELIEIPRNRCFGEHQKRNNRQESRCFARNNSAAFRTAILLPLRSSSRRRLAMSAHVSARIRFDRK